MAVLYRCKAPTDLVCRCGKVARRLRAMEIDYEEVRVPFLKRDRPKVEELSGQRWVPVLVHGEEVITGSGRILEYLEQIDSAASARPEAALSRTRSDSPRAARSKGSGRAGLTKSPSIRSAVRSSRAEPER